jgi:hypothetical protein
MLEDHVAGGNEAKGPAAALHFYTKAKGGPAVKKEKICFYLDADTAKWVRTEAAHRHVSPSGLLALALSYLRVVGAVEEHFADLKTDIRAIQLMLTDLAAQNRQSLENKQEG